MQAQVLHQPVSCVVTRKCRKCDLQKLFLFGEKYVNAMIFSYHIGMMLSL